MSQAKALKRLWMTTASMAAIEWSLRAQALDAKRAAAERPDDTLKPGQGLDTIGDA